MPKVALLIFPSWTPHFVVWMPHFGWTQCLNYTVDICLSVCLSDGRVFLTAEDIVKLLSQPGSPSFCFLTRAPIPNSKGNLFSGGVKYTVVGKICDFRLKSPFISETVRDRPMLLWNFNGNS